ncbi:VOC family protein [Streptomyces gamaensis]|uniref:VOC family protein n=1 Tax=Streptomyces gamaensis TaxID=1763542 RepID=A0ABW0Z4R0_9ACTN
MTIRRVNHVTLSVTDIDASVGFYRDVLGLKVVDSVPRPDGTPLLVFLRSAVDSENHHDLALLADASPAGGGDASSGPGLAHVAFEVGTLDELAAAKTRLEAAGAVKECLDQGMHLSVYATDPDGIGLEIIWRVPAEDWSYGTGIERVPLDLEKARARWGGGRVTGASA